MVRRGLRATLDGTVYPIEAWDIQQQGPELREEWTSGWRSGAGQFEGTERERYYWAVGMDASDRPLRLQPAYDATITITNLNPTQPVYMFKATASYAYILNDRYSYKLKLGTNTIVETVDHGVGAVCGKPGLFEGKWYFPLGASVNAKQLTTIAADPSTDTFTSLGVKALSFAVTVRDGTARLSRAHTTNLIDATAAVTAFDSTDWAGDDFEVGDSSLRIVEHHSWLGEEAVIKGDAVYRFDGRGNAFPIEEFGGRNPVPLEDYEGANSAVHSAYLYWPHSSGLWRFFGGRGLPIGLESAPDFQNIILDSAEPFKPDARWRSCVAIDRWLYAINSHGTNGARLYYGFIRDDGTVLWQGAIATYSTNAVLGLIERSTFPAAGNPPSLFVAVSGTLYRIRLNRDGSLRTPLGTNKGVASTTYYFYLPVSGMGQPDRPKQLRRFAVEQRNGVSTCTVQPIVLRDRAVTSENVGSTFTANGWTENKWTPGTNDLAFSAQFGLKLVTSAGYAPSTSDPQIWSIVVEAATPTVIRAVIPCTDEGLKETGQTKATVRRALLNLLNGPAFNVTEPDTDGTPDTYTARVVAYSEQAVTSDSELGKGWNIVLSIVRHDYGN